MEKKAQLIASSVVALVVIAFIYLGFIDEQVCHSIDKDSLWCRLHPMLVEDWIGTILFLIGASIIAGVPKLFGYDPVAWDGSWRTWTTLVITAAGIILIWLN